MNQAILDGAVLVAEGILIVQQPVFLLLQHRLRKHFEFMNFDGVEGFLRVGQDAPRAIFAFGIIFRQDLFHFLKHHPSLKLAHFCAVLLLHEMLLDFLFLGLEVSPIDGFSVEYLH